MVSADGLIRPKARQAPRAIPLRGSAGMSRNHQATTIAPNAMMHAQNVTACARPAMLTARCLSRGRHSMPILGLRALSAASPVRELAGLGLLRAHRTQRRKFDGRHPTGPAPVSFSGMRWRRYWRWRPPHSALPPWWRASWAAPAMIRTRRIGRKPNKGSPTFRPAGEKRQKYLGKSTAEIEDGGPGRA